MLTVNHVTYQDDQTNEHIFLVSSVSQHLPKPGEQYKEGRFFGVVIQMPDGYFQHFPQKSYLGDDSLQINLDKIYVMNDLGKTVATYYL